METPSGKATAERERESGQELAVEMEPTEKKMADIAPANSIGTYLSLPWRSRSVSKGARLRSGETREMSTTTSFSPRSENPTELWLTPPSRNDSTCGWSW